MWMLIVLVASCGWWDKRQACGAAQAADAAGWSELQATLDTSSAAAAHQASASRAAVESVEASLAQAVAAAPPDSGISRGEAAQDAFTRASRLGGTAKGLSDARWTDWTMKAQAQARDADRLAEQASREVERLELWGRAHADATIALVLTSARYEARVRSGAARLTISLNPAAALSPSAATEPEQVAELRAALGEAAVTMAELRRNLARVAGELDTLAFRVDSAGQTAAGSARNYEFLGFPPEAQVAQAAALAAASAGKRATEAAATLRTAVAKWRAETDSDAVEAPPEVTEGLARAVGLAHAAEEACR